MKVKDLLNGRKLKKTPFLSKNSLDLLQQLTKSMKLLTKHP